MLRYKTHVENQGWQEFKNMGEVSGVVGKKLQIEAIVIECDLSLEYRVHSQNIGWQEWKKNGEVAGTTGRGLQVEAIEIRLVDSSKYSIHYHTHTQNIGWMDWAIDGESAGTEGRSLQAEGIQILILDKGINLNVDATEQFIKYVAPIATPIIAQNLRKGNGQLVCLNPGHGGSDSGAIGNLLEKDMNLAVCLRLAQLLQERNFRVVLTRSTDIWMALSDRPAIANNVNADIFVSDHHNGSNDPNSSYSMAICYPGSTEGIRLGQNVLNGIVSRLKLPDSGITQRDDSDVTYSDMPSVITEACFTSSPRDCAMFINGGCELEAQGILEGILNYFGC